MSILIFVIILLVLVLVHEAGHFFSAKKFGIRVDEFGFGFPPKIFGVKKGETEYSINLLPIGGFVRIFGEEVNDETSSGPDAKRSFVNKPKYQQAIVLVAGVLANFALAWLLFSIGFISGLPSSVNSGLKGAEFENVNLTIITVAPNSPADRGGLKSGDKIVSATQLENNAVVDEDTELTPESIKEFVTEHSGDEISIGYLRGKNNEFQVTKIVPEGPAESPAIGISMDQIGTAKLGPIKAVYEGLKLTALVTKGTVLGLFNLVFDAIRGKGSMESVTGPVGLVGVVGDAYQFGFVYLLSFAALISVNLGVINLVPFPALDGGRLFFLLIEKIKGSPLSPKVSNMANMIGFCLLLLLMAVVTYHDIVKLF